MSLTLDEIWLLQEKGFYFFNDEIEEYYVQQEDFNFIGCSIHKLTLPLPLPGSSLRDYVAVGSDGSFYSPELRLKLR